MIFGSYSIILQTVLLLIVLSSVGASILREFKTTLMHFSEPYLAGAAIDGYALEGETNVYAANTLSRALDALPEYDDLNNFKQSLLVGTCIAERIMNKSAQQHLTFSQMSNKEIATKLKADAKGIQNIIIEDIRKYHRLIIPTIWIKHASVLILKSGENNTYDMVFANTGEGIEFHLNAKDPNGIYPFVTQVWVEFNGIPKSIIFSNSAWFIQAIFLINSELMSKKLGKDNIHVFFYRTVLGNFKRFVIAPIPVNDPRLVPMQRSGSCSWSSLMAALLFVSGSAEKFYLYRLKIGHVLMENFLNEASKSDSLKTILSNGQKLQRRNFFKGLSSSLALQALQYLEHKFPTEFNHSGLLGSTQSEWLSRKKESALAALQEAPETITLLNNTINLCNAIMTFLKTTCPIDPNSNKIMNINSIRESYVHPFEENLSDIFGLSKKVELSMSSTNISEIIDETPYRHVIDRIDDFDKLSQSLEIITQEKAKDMKFFYRVLDIFKESFRGDVELLKQILVQISEEKKGIFIKTLKICNDIINRFYLLEKSSISLDEIIILGVLQRFAWELSVAYDNLLTIDNKIGLAEYDPPQTLQSVFQHLSLQNMYDYQHFAVFYNFIGAARTESTAHEKSAFLGPEEYFPINTKVKNLKSIEDKSKSFYRILMDQINDETVLLFESKSPSPFLSDEEIKFIIIFSRFSSTVKLSPQYYSLMDILSKIRLCAFIKKERKVTDKINTERYWLNFKEATNEFMTSYVVKIENNKDVNDEFKIAIKSSQSDGGFYELMSIKTKDVRLTNFEIWFNYIKGSRSAKIFDSVQFQHSTDHILNIPKLYRNPDNRDDMVNFESFTAYQTITELTRLIKISLESINNDTKIMMSYNTRKQLVNRVVNISVLLARFISRIDYENVLTMDASAKALSQVYNTIFLYTFVKSKFLLQKPEISRLNFALSHICSIVIRDPVTFVRNITLNIGNYSGPINLKSLERYHWFVANLNGFVDKSVEGVANDQFNYGMIGSPLFDEEKPFFEALIKFYFLQDMVLDPADYSEFQFDSNGYKLTIFSRSNSRNYIILNLWSGAIIQNGQLVLSSSIFVNSPEFNTFFKQEDIKLALKGTLVQYADKIIYNLPDFKGSCYLILLTVEKGTKSLTVYRKESNLWYTWIPLNSKTSRLGGILKYPWLNKSKIFGHYSGILKIFPEDEASPILTLKSAPELIISFSGFENYNWVFKRFIHDQKNIFLGNTHLGSFDSIANIAMTNNNRLVFICTGYRLPNDPNRPLILLENENDSFVFDVMNIPGMKIKRNQSLNDETSLQGALVAEKDSKKMILVPYSKRIFDDSNVGKYSNENFIDIRMIPIIDGIPVPQTRADKLLISYTFITNRNFDMAKHFLHPNVSIHQNEPFSVEELTVMKWIAEFESQLLEIIALKLITYVHIVINRSKFPLEYERNQNLSSKSFENLDILKDLSSKYLFSLRELPEKYHMHQVFPEILRKKLFVKVFSTVHLERGSRIAVKNHATQSVKSVLDLFGTVLNERDAEALGDSTKTGILEFNDDDLSFAHRLYIWDNTLSIDYLRFIYLLIQSPYSWADYWAKAEIIKDKNGLIVFNPKSTQLANFISSRRELMKIRSFDFYGIDFFDVSSSTGLETIRNTLMESLKDSIETNDHSATLKNQLLIDENIVAAISTLRFKLLGFVKYDRGNSKILIKIKESFSKLFGFNKNEEIIETSSDYVMIGENVLMKSKILSNLNDSISMFIAENGIGQVTKVRMLNEQNNLLFDLKLKLEEYIGELEQLQIRLVEDLCQFVYFETLNDDGSKLFELILRSMHKKKSYTFESLYVCILEENPVLCFQNKFPQFNMQVCRKLSKDSFIFYQRQSLIGYFKMLLEYCNSFLSHSTEEKMIDVDEIKMFCDELDKARYFISRSQYPVIINFEFRSGKYIVKNEQVDDIARLTSIDPSSDLFNSVVIQRMMAAGKTLVLGTISTVTKALNNRPTLSILVPPASLYQSNTTDMQNRTYSYFKKKGKIFMFNRFNLDDKLSDYLDTVIGIIEDTMKSRDYLILSPESLHSFLNSYIELLYENSSCSHHKSILEKFAQIYLIFKEKSSIIFDEIDMTMDPKKELNFPYHKHESYNMTAVTLIADIVEFILFDEEIIDTGLKIYSNNQASLTTEKFIKCRNIILNYIEKKLTDSNSPWFHLITKKMREDDDSKIRNIMEFLSTSDMTFLENWIKSVHAYDEILANSLIIIKRQLYQYLENALKGTVNHNYGPAGKLRPQLKFAVPYVAANTPSTASVFADRWETLLKTLLMISAMPCTEEIAKNIIQYSKKTISIKSSNELSLDVAPTYKNMELLLPTSINPLNLDDKNDIDVSIVQKCLSLHSPVAIRLLFEYYINEVFAELTFPVIQITSNAINMTSMFASVQGYSGTIDNVNILPHETVAAAYIDHDLNKKHNGGIALKLINDSVNSNVMEFAEKSFSKNVQDMTEDMFDLFSNINDQISAIVDAGAFFKMFKNKQVAKAILNHYRGEMEVVMYYDEDTNQLEFIRISEGIVTTGYIDSTDPVEIEKVTNADISKRFTFYDQRHITGSDIPQPVYAHAVMTVGPRVLLRDILQGTLRMRRFMKSQKVHLITTESTRNFYSSKIETLSETLDAMKVSDLLALGSVNEDEKQAIENEKLAFIKIDSEIRSFVLYEVSQMLVVDDISAANRVFQSSKNLFIRESNEEPLTWLIPKTRTDTVKTLEAYVEKKLIGLNELTELHNSSNSNDDKLVLLKQKISQMINAEATTPPTDSLRYYLGKEIENKLNFDFGTEVQMEAKAETQTEANSQALTEVDINNLLDNECCPSRSKASFPIGIYDKLRSKKNRLKSISSISKYDQYKFTSMNNLYSDSLASGGNKEDVSKLLLTDGKCIGVTRDLFRPYKNLTIFTMSPSEGSHLFIDEVVTSLDDGTKEKLIRVLLLSRNTANDLYNDLFNSLGTITNNDKIWLCDLSGNVTLSNSGQDRGQSIYDLLPNVAEHIFDLLIFNGSLPQILDNPMLREIYYERWINCEGSVPRAKFLLRRMALLAKKINVMFDYDDDALIELKTISDGQNVTFKNDKKSEKGFKKFSRTPIDSEINESTIRRMELDRNVSYFEPSTNNSAQKDLFDALESFFNEEIMSNETKTNE